MFSVVNELFDLVMSFLQKNGYKAGGLIATIYIIGQTDKTKKIFIKIVTSILRVLFIRVINFTLKVTKEGGVINDVIKDIKKALEETDEKKITEIKEEVKENKANLQNIKLNELRVYFELYRPLDAIIIDKKLFSRSKFFRNIIRRRKLRRNKI